MLEELIDAGVPLWVTKDKSSGEELKMGMPCWLHNETPTDSNGKEALKKHPPRPQLLHFDMAPGTTLASFLEYLDAKIVVTSGDKSVFIWVVLGSSELLKALVMAHLKHGPSDKLRGRKKLLQEEEKKRKKGGEEEEAPGNLSILQYIHMW